LKTFSVFVDELGNEGGFSFTPSGEGARSNMASLAFHAAVARVASLTRPRCDDARARSSSSRATTTTTCRAGRDDYDRESSYPAADRRPDMTDERRYYDGGRRSSRTNDYFDRRAKPTSDSRPAVDRGPTRARRESRTQDTSMTPPSYPRRGNPRDDGFREREASMRAEADARAAREETMWRDAYTKRVEEKRQRWDEWDDMAAEEDTARKDRVARTNSRKPGSKTPSQRRDRLARYRDISRRADETWAASIERRWTADESYARTTGYKPRGDGVDRTMDWLFTPLAGAARKIDAWLEDDPYNPLTNPGYYGGYDAPPMPPPGQMYEQYDMPGGSAMNAMGWGGPRRGEERDDDRRAMRTQAPEYYATQGGGPPPPYASSSPPPPPAGWREERRGGGNPLGDMFRGGGGDGGGGWRGADRGDEAITPEEFEALRGGTDFDKYRGTASGRRTRGGRR
jgi:hypothetical protein